MLVQREDNQTEDLTAVLLEVSHWASVPPSTSTAEESAPEVPVVSSLGGLFDWFRFRGSSEDEFQGDRN